MPERVRGGTPNDVRIDFYINDFDKLIDYKVMSFYHRDVNKYWTRVIIKKYKFKIYEITERKMVSFYKSRAKTIFDIAQRALQK